MFMFIVWGENTFSTFRHLYRFRHRYYVHVMLSCVPGPDLGGGRGPRAPGLPPTGGLPPNPLIFKTL